MVLLDCNEMYTRKKKKSDIFMKNVCTYFFYKLMMITFTTYRRHSIAWNNKKKAEHRRL